MFPSLYRWFCRYIHRSNVQQNSMCLEHQLQPVGTFGSAAEAVSQGVEILVYTFGSLFPHHTKADVPLLKLRDDMLFKYVHLWENSVAGEVLSDHLKMVNLTIVYNNSSIYM